MIVLSRQSERNSIHEEVGKERNRHMYDAISGTKHEKYLLIHVSIMHVRNTVIKTFG